MKSFWGPRLAAAIAAVCLALSFPAIVRAQTTTVSTTYLGGVVPFANATIYWQSVIPARVGTSGGQVTGMPLQGTVTNGVSSLTVADAEASSPNTCYAVTVVDNVSGAVLLGAGLDASGHVKTGGAYGCVQPTGSTWNFDTYQPSATTVLPAPSGGTVTGPMTFNAPVTFSSTVNGGNANFSTVGAGASNISGNQAVGGNEAVSGALSANASIAATAAPSTVPQILVDDNVDTDVDEFMFLSAINHWINAGQVKVLAMVADSSNPYAAPVMSIINSYWGHASIPVGAYQGGSETGSTWTAAVVSEFRSGDTRANYPACVTTLRTQLAGAANSSIIAVGTGFNNCWYPFLESAADGISSLTGAQLWKAKGIRRVVMGGDYPSSSGEFNFATSDPADWSADLALETAQNGFPPIYFVGYTAGLNVISGLPTWFPASDPARYGLSDSPYANRPSWDTMAYWYGIFGNLNSAFTVSASGTNTVNATTGANSWSSSPASGQYYLTDNQGPAFYEAYLDGQSYQGAEWFIPYQQPGALIFPPFECAPAYGCSASKLPDLALGGLATPSAILDVWVPSSGAGIQESLNGSDAWQLNINNLGSWNLWDATHSKEPIVVSQSDDVGIGLSTTALPAAILDVWVPSSGAGIQESLNGSDAWQLNINSNGAWNLWDATHGLAPLVVSQSDLVQLTAEILTSAAPTVGSGQIGYGSTTASAADCGSISAAGCIVVNISGTTHYIPYF